MSRSYRKHDYIGHGSSSEKYDKQLANRTLRHHVRQILHVDPEQEILPIMREVSNLWCMSKDGKIYFGNLLSERDHRFPNESRCDDPKWIKMYRKMKTK